MENRALLNPFELEGCRRQWSRASPLNPRKKMDVDGGGERGCRILGEMCELEMRAGMINPHHEKMA